MMERFNLKVLTKQTSNKQIRKKWDYLYDANSVREVRDVMLNIVFELLMEQRQERRNWVQAQLKKEKQ